MKKISTITLSLFSSIFLIGFIISYKNSGKIRESIRIAIIWAIVTLSLISTEAKSTGLPGADGFTPPANSHPANKGSGLFNQPKPQNQDPGSDKPGGNGDDNNSNSNFERECIEKSENSKPDNPYHYWHEPMHHSDSETIDTESESDWSSDSAWDEENFLKSLFVTASDGRILELEKEQFRDKAHHLDVFPNIKIPKTFDLDYVKTLDYNSRLKYVRDRSKLPEKTVFDMQMEASKFFRSKQTKAFYGSVDRTKIQGTVYINYRTRTVAFVNNSNSKCRTIITMSERQL